MTARAFAASDLGDFEFRRLFKQYSRALAAFRSGRFADAVRDYRDLAATLRPRTMKLLRAGMAVGDTEDLASLTAASLTPEARAAALGQMQKGASREVALCSAIAHDCALIARFQAESSEMGRNPQVIEAVRLGFATAICINPGFSPAHFNFAGYEHFLGNLEKAREEYAHAVSMDPRFVEGWITYANTLADLGQRAESDAAYHRAMALDRQTAIASMIVGQALLQRGAWIGGWARYEDRWQAPEFVARNGRSDITSPRWNGGAFDGTVLVYPEQGAGDQMQMLRYVPLVAARCQSVVVEAHPPLVNVTRAMLGDGVRVVSLHEPVAHDASIPMMSLPHVFSTTIASVPPPLSWRPRDAESRVVGICWRGSSTHGNDLQRSAPFEAFAPILDACHRLGLTVQSLQFGHEVNAPDGHAPVDPLPIGDFLTTAHAIARCSVVISVDTSIAHLAASMGVDTRVLLPVNAEWRWMQDRSDSPWYPSATLYRQTAPGDWAGVVTRVVDLLTERYG